MIFSRFLKQKSLSNKITYLALVTAFLTASNAFLEFKTFDVQFSLTITLSMFAGIILGGGAGCICCFIADGLGFLISSWGYMYMPWVGISSGVTALITGSLFSGEEPLKNLALKGAIAVLFTFLICTVFINSGGFYFYNYIIGFSTTVINYIKETFGSDVTFIFYCVYRLIFKGQIFNSIFNYILFFLGIPILKKLKIFS